MIKIVCSCTVERLSYVKSKTLLVTNYFQHCIEQANGRELHRGIGRVYWPRRSMKNSDIDNESNSKWFRHNVGTSIKKN